MKKKNKKDKYSEYSRCKHKNLVKIVNSDYYTCADCLKRGLNK